MERGRVIYDDGAQQFTPEANGNICPLCGCGGAQLYHRGTSRDYLICCRCRLVFVPSRFRLSRLEEKAEYDLHQNESNQQGYRNFLSRLMHPLLLKLGAQPRLGLDFGCGPGPTLSLMLEEYGHSVELYDPLYFNSRTVLSQKYDFVCATEVVEHFHKPSHEFDLLFSCLKPGGWLGIMTKLVRDQPAFTTWHYTRDLTHVSFFSKATFSYLAKVHDTSLEFAAADVILMGKK